jgi:hypothetical protein
MSEPGDAVVPVVVSTLFVWLLAYARPFWNHVQIGLFSAPFMFRAKPRARSPTRLAALT